jgi:hypothetical protein
MFSFVFSQKPAEHGEEEHQELPEIVGPFLTGGVAMMMNFHRLIFKLLIID